MQFKKAKEKISFGYAGKRKLWNIEVVEHFTCLILTYLIIKLKDFLKIFEYADF